MIATDRTQWRAAAMQHTAKTYGRDSNMNRFSLLVLAALFPGSGIVGARGIPGLCGMRNASVSDHPAGTNGQGTGMIQILVSSPEQGQCKSKNDVCKQTRGCKIDFNLHTPAGWSVFQTATAEVDPGVTRDDLVPGDWARDPTDSTGTHGHEQGLNEFGSCGKHLLLDAIGGGAVARATLECGECDENERP